VHLTPPVVTNAGGPVLKAPVFVPVTFDEDLERADLEALVGTIAGSPYWAQVTAEYGVGAATVGTPVHVAQAAPKTASNTDIETWLVAHAGVDWPAPTDANVYVVFYPSTSALTADGATACTDLGGWHAEAARPGKRGLPYVAMPRCTSFGDITGADVMSVTLSHELVEVVTDPLPRSQPAFRFVDDASAAWMVVLAGQTEIGDMCVNEAQANVKLAGLPLVQRIWSNSAASAGRDPCVPAPSAPYFNAQPDDTGSITLVGPTGQKVPVPGVPVPPGASRTTSVHLYSDKPTAPFSVRAVDITALLGGAAELELSLDRTSGSNGDTLRLTIKRLLPGSHYGSSPFAIVTTLGATRHYWFGLAG
jgi:hypothetical protein